MNNRIFTVWVTYLFKIKVHSVEMKKNTNSKPKLHHTNFRKQKEDRENVFSTHMCENCSTDSYLTC